MTLRFSTVLITALGALIVTMCVFVATSGLGLYNIDEALYLISAETLRDTGQLAIQNTLDGLSSPDLRMWYLVDGPLGLVAQYPLGVTLAAQPLMGMLGPHALLALNAIAGIGTLLVTHALARHLFESARIANLAILLLALCTYWLEYVFALWPHAISVFFIVSAILSFVHLLDRDHSVFFPASVTGLLIGLGMLFRLEAILLLPAIAAITLLYARRPLTTFAGGTLGLGIVMVFFSLSNEIRFGTLSPLTYGRSGGVTDAASFLPLGTGLFAALLFLALLRGANERRRRVLIYAAFCLACVGTVTILFIHDDPIQLLMGPLAILIDARLHYSDIPGAMLTRPDGTVLFWGLPKKALGQSLPWLGCLAALAFIPWGKNRRSISMLLIFVIVWSLPFVLQAWHGGLSSNPRLFLPMLPLFATLCAWILLALSGTTFKRDSFALSAVAVLGCLSLFLLVWAMPDLAFSLHQVWSLPILFGITGVALVASRVSYGFATRSLLVAIAIGAGFSGFLAVQDFQATMLRRDQTKASAEAVATISGRVLFFGPPESFYPALSNPEQRLALPDQHSFEPDEDLIEMACLNGFRVIMDHFMARPLAHKTERIVQFDWPTPIQGPYVVEVNCDTYTERSD